jgi:cytochrome c
MNMNKYILKLLSLHLTFFITGCATQNSNFLKRFPELKNAKYKIIEVPDRIEGNTFTESHRVYVIDSPAYWRRSD